MDFKTFLVFMQGTGIEAIVGFIWSFVVEWVPQWETLSARVKRIAMWAICTTVPVLAKVLELAFYGGAWGDFPNTWFPMLVAGFVAFGGSQIAHLRKLGTP
jgi:hypothetical protein